jgi:LCP family protein required for cell wall assembly
VAWRGLLRAWQDWALGHPWPVGIALAVIALLLVVAIVAVRANRTLATIQQEDPRLRPTATAARAQPTSAATAVANGTFGAPLQPTRPPLPDMLREPFNVLLIGVDKRPDLDDGVRSDTLIVVHVDPQAKWASMLSIPRDTVVTIPYVGQAKINAAYSSGYTGAAQIYGEGTTPEAGGAALAAETVEAFLGVRVDYTAQVDFHGFAALVDSVGGVVVDVPRPLLDAEYPTEDYGVERIYIPAGLQVFDGRAALIYARSRHLSNDFDRGKRQQAVLRALFDQVRGRGLLENVATVPEWAAMLEQNIRTTLPIGDLGTIGGLAALARELNPNRVLQLTINPIDVAVDAEDGSNIYWNRRDIAALVARWEAGPPSAAPAANDDAVRIQVLNGAAVAGLAGRVSAFLTDKGFTLADPDQAPQVYAHTTIIDYTGRPQTRQRLTETLGIDPRYVATVPGPDSPTPVPSVDLVVILGADYRPEWAGE